MCFIFVPGHSTTRPLESSPENCSVAPSKESIIDPKRPATPPNMMRGHWGGLAANILRSTA